MAKKIMFYCGFESSNGGVYVLNGKDYLSMRDKDRVEVLSGIIAELSHELEFVVQQVNAGTKTALTDQELLQ